MKMLTVFNSRDRWLWYLYDFANSIALVSVAYYFSLWAVVDNGMSQWVVSLPVSLSTLLMLIVMPRIARRVDGEGWHKRAMLIFSFLSALSLLCISLLGPSEYLTYYVLTLAFLFYFCYQSGYVFFTSFLKELSDKTSQIKISGIGQLWGQIGNLAGVVLSFATAGLAVFGIIGKQQIFLWAAIIFMAFLIPFYWFRRNVFSEKTIHTEGTDVSVATFKKIYANKKVFWFLISYIFYADGMMTISFFVTLYLSKALHFSDFSIKIGALFFLLGTILGGLLTALLQKYDQLKSIKILLWIWPVLLIVISLIANVAMTIILFVFVGVVFSMIFAVSRSFYSSLIPNKERAEYFSVYVIFERMGAVVGPIIWSSVVSAFIFLGESTAYRIAMAVTAIITGVSVVIFRKVEKEFRVLKT